MSQYRLNAVIAHFTRDPTGPDGIGRYRAVACLLDPLWTHRERTVERLTDATAKAARPGAVARDLADGTVPGLALRVLPSGAKTWALRARLGGQRSGRSWHLSCDDTEGRPPQGPRRLADHRAGRRSPLRRHHRRRGRDRVSGLKIGDCRERTLANERRRFEIHVLPVIGTHGIRTVKPAKLSALLRDVATGADPKPVEANRVYASLRGLFRWCRRNMGCPDDPTALIDKPTKVEPSVVRRREGTEPLLDMSELAHSGMRLQRCPAGCWGLLKCLLLVPLRREEWTGLAWREVRDDFTADGWTGAALQIPAARMKGRRPAVAPLSPAVAGILEARRELTGRGDFVFAVPGRNTPFAGWRRGADVLRAASASERIGAPTRSAPRSRRPWSATSGQRSCWSDVFCSTRPVACWASPTPISGHRAWPSRRSCWAGGARSPGRGGGVGECERTRGGVAADDGRPGSPRRPAVRCLSVRGWPRITEGA